MFKYLRHGLKCLETRPCSPGLCVGLGSIGKFSSPGFRALQTLATCSAVDLEVALVGKPACRNFSCQRSSHCGLVLRGLWGAFLWERGLELWSLNSERWVSKCRPREGNGLTPQSRARSSRRAEGLASHRAMSPLPPPKPPFRMQLSQLPFLKTVEDLRFSSAGDKAF